MHFMQRKQFSEPNAILHAFPTNFRFEDFPECVRGPLNTLWRATSSPQAYS